MDFHPFQPDGELEIYRLHLPHWRQPGVTYFVTTRLADSLPAGKLRALNEERAIWLNARQCGTEADFARLPKNERDDFHRYFTAKIHAWLDAGEGSCALRRPECARVVADALKHFEGERYVLDHYVIMPNHLHLLVTPAPGG